MRRMSFAAVLALFALGSAGTASAQINNCQGNGAIGTVVGAVVGGTAGGVIANNTRGFRNRGFRQGFGGRGFRGRGFGRRGFRGSNRGNQELGAILGAVAGGIAGNQIANARRRNCINRVQQQQVIPSQQPVYTNGQVLAGGPIDHNARRLGDPYGGQRVIQSQPVHAQPQAQVYNPAVVHSGHTSIVTDPHVHNSPVHHGQGGNFPISTQSTGRVIQQAPSQGVFQPAPRQGVFQPTCQNVNRTTRLPDGRVLNEPVEFCQFSQGGQWIQR